LDRYLEIATMNLGSITKCVMNWGSGAEGSHDGGVEVSARERQLLKTNAAATSAAAGSEPSGTGGSFIFSLSD
jgi:hypothetical protein